MHKEGIDAYALKHKTICTEDTQELLVCPAFDEIYVAHHMYRHDTPRALATLLTWF